MKSNWLRLVTVAGALFLGGGVAGAHGGSGGGGTNPNTDTGTPASGKAATTTTTTTTSSQSKSTVAPDSHATPTDAKRSSDLNNSPGGSDETTVPSTSGRH